MLGEIQFVRFEQLVLDGAGFAEAPARCKRANDFRHAAYEHVHARELDQFVVKRLHGFPVEFFNEVCQRRPAEGQQEL